MIYRHLICNAICSGLKGKIFIIKLIDTSGEKSPPNVQALRLSFQVAGIQNTVSWSLPIICTKAVTGHTQVILWNQKQRTQHCQGYTLLKDTASQCSGDTKSSALFYEEIIFISSSCGPICPLVLQFTHSGTKFVSHKTVQWYSNCIIRIQCEILQTAIKK